MQTLIENGGVVYKHTSVYLPCELHKNAKKHGINMSALLRDAITEELQARGIEMLQTHESPEPKTPTTKMNASTHSITRRNRDE